MNWSSFSDELTKISVDKESYVIPRKWRKVALGAGIGAGLGGLAKYIAEQTTGEKNKQPDALSGMALGIPVGGIAGYLASPGKRWSRAAIGAGFGAASGAALGGLAKYMTDRQSQGSSDQ